MIYDIQRKTMVHCRFNAFNGTVLKAVLLSDSQFNLG